MLFTSYLQLEIAYIIFGIFLPLNICVGFLCLRRILEHLASPHITDIRQFN